MKRNDMMDVLIRVNDGERVRIIDSYSGEVAEGDIAGVISWVEGLDESFEGQCEFTLDRTYRYCPKVLKESIICLKGIWQPGEVLEVNGDLVKIKWLNDGKVLDYNMNLVEDGTIIIIQF